MHPALFPPLPTLALLVSLVFPAGARGREWNVAARAGLANPAGEQVLAGPSMGAAVRMGLGPRYRLALEIDGSRHVLRSDSRHGIDALTAWLSLQAALDELPVMPTVGLGPALQYARGLRSGDGLNVGALGASLGLRAPLPRGVEVGAHVRYLTASFTAEGLPSFTSFCLELGWRGP